VKPEERSIRILRINQEVLLRHHGRCFTSPYQGAGAGAEPQRRRSRQGIGDVGDGQAGSGARGAVGVAEAI